ncbi:hypothetical protein WM40_20410 [Robbsia andropogonis]|uniref:Polysaccharide biosynthesis protein n=1 Tax=Robbsia andropogonis TaxID=28092 RepID=A0A0F5JWA3_9BURK|nr:oligosaccharide flippase family protein [Robbsia andropogonis]KKB61944.1 hypothetical protein WM40_20410 [Robbsia andropogonis]
MRRVIGNAFSLGAVQIVSQLLPLLSLPYLARTLGASELGRLGFALSIGQIMITITDYGFNLSGAKSASVNRNDSLKLTRLFCSITSIRIILAMLGFAVFSAFYKSNSRSDEDFHLFLAAYTAVLGNIIFPLWFFQGLEQLKFVSLVQIISRLVMFLLTFALIKSPEDVVIACLLQSIGYVIGAIVVLPLLFRILNVSDFSWATLLEIRQELKSGWNLFLSTAAVSAYSSCNTFILGFFVSPALLGHYNIAEKMLRGIVTVYGAISSAVYPHVVELAAQSKEKVVNFNKRLLWAFGGASAIVAILIIILAPTVIPWLFGDKYLQSINILQVFSLMFPLVVVSNILGILTMLPFGMERCFSRILIISALLNFLLFTPMIKFFSVSGAVWANVIIECFVTLAMGIALVKSGYILKSKASMRK